MQPATAESAPRPRRHFEDYRPGMTFDLGSVTVTEAEILDFAGRYDPQSFHTDPAAAARSPYGGLIASGWHTAALMMRLLATRFLDESSLGSPGIDELRWLRPVRPGDTLHVSVTIGEARRSRSKPDRGIVRSEITVANQAGLPVLTMTAMNLLLARTTGDGADAS